MGAIAVGDGRQINGTIGGGGGGEGEVESWIGRIERNPEDGWEHDRLPRAKGRKKGGDGDTPREGRSERRKNCNSE